MAFCVIGIAVLLNGGRFLLSYLPDKNQFFSAIASDFLQQPVLIKTAKIQGSALHPIFIFDDLRIAGASARELQMGVDVIRSVWQHRWVLRPVTVRNVRGVFSGPDGFSMTGRVNGDRQQGVLQLFGKRADFATPLLFSHRIPLVNFDLTLQWQRVGTGWRINVSRFAAKNMQLRFISEFLLQLLPHQSPRLSFLGRLSFSPLQKAKLYFPDRILAPELMHWLNHAFLSGQVENARLLFHGSVTHFPFDQQDGHFEVIAPLKNVTVRFANDWPVLKKYDGDLEADNRGMSFFIQNAEIAENPVQFVQARIADLATPVLTVDAKSDTDLSHGMQLLRQSPLLVAHDIGAIDGQGPVSVVLQLKIPLTHFPLNPAVTGSLVFLKDQVSLPKWALQLSDLRGALQLENKAVTGKNLSIIAWKKPFVFSVKTQKNRLKQPFLHAYGHGVFDIDAMQAQQRLPLLSFFRGQTPVFFSANLNDIATSMKNTFTLSSDLKGLSIVSMPRPFVKSAQQLRPLHVDLKWLPSGEITAGASLKNWFSTMFSGVFQQNGFHLMRGLLRFGKLPAQLPTHFGFYIDGHLSLLDVDDWQHWFTHWQSRFGHSHHVSYALPWPSALQEINLTIDRLSVWQHDWYDTYLKLTPNASGTLLQLQNAVLLGDILFPSNTEKPISGHFQYLFLSPRKNDDELSTLNPQTIPPLDFRVENFHLNNQFDGEVHLITAPIAHGLVIRKLKAKTHLFTLNAKGKWEKKAGESQSILMGRFESSDLGRLLWERHLSSRLKGGEMSSAFSFMWPGNPMDFSLQKAGGAIDIDLSKGRIMQLDTETESNLDFGKLLNVLSLESISQYLSFNFSSFTKKGFSFHYLRGTFHVDHGDVFTKNIKMDGPVAEVTMTGLIGLKHQKNDLTLTVLPHISSSLPVIIGLAGGPIAGIATWVADKIVDPGVGHLMRMTYHVSGSWQHPVVKKMAS